MMKAAWEIALTPSMRHMHFSVLVKWQRINGVRLVTGKDNNKAVTSLLEMADFGWTDPHYLKNALDGVFNDTGNVPLADYETKLVSATSDGTNVNLGVYNGALTQLAHERPWLVTVHCVNHRLELAMKDTISQIIDYQECDRFYTTIFYLFKNSEKLKTLAKKAAEALNITWYHLPKLYLSLFPE